MRGASRSLPTSRQKNKPLGQSLKKIQRITGSTCFHPDDCFKEKLHSQMLNGTGIFMYINSWVVFFRGGKFVGKYTTVPLSVLDWHIIQQEGWWDRSGRWRGMVSEGCFWEECKGDERLSICWEE